MTLSMAQQAIVGHISLSLSALAKLLQTNDRAKTSMAMRQTTSSNHRIGTP
jgi:hypothetical protein